MPEVRVRAVFRGGDADDGKLDLYDGAEALQGFARAMTLMARAYTTTKAVSKVFNIKGVKLFREPPRHGSFIDGILIHFDDGVITAAQAQQFYQMVGWCFNEAVASEDAGELEGPLSKRMVNSADQLVSFLEEPIKHMHRPIRQDPRISLTVERVKGEQLAVYNADSAARFEEQVSANLMLVPGSVTRFSSDSGWGSFRSEKDGRAVSFQLNKSVSKARRSLVTASLHRYDRDEESRIALKARPVIVGGGRIKRYIVDDVDHAS